MKNPLSALSGYRTYLLGAALILQALASILGGDLSSITEILKSPELAQLLAGGGLITLRAGVSTELAKSIEALARNSRHRIIAFVFALGTAVMMTACAASSRFAETHDEICLSACAADCAMTCESKCRVTPPADARPATPP